METPRLREKGFPSSVYPHRTELEIKFGFTIPLITKFVPAALSETSVMGVKIHSDGRKAVSGRKMQAEAHSGLVLDAAAGLSGAQ